MAAAVVTTLDGRPIKTAPIDRKTVYDAAGVAYVRWPVDANEMLATGQYFSEPPVVVETEPETAETGAAIFDKAQPRKRSRNAPDKPGSHSGE